MKLYSFPTSSASWRVRTVLHLKGIPFETVTVNLPDKEQRREPYLRINPQNRLPALELDDGTIVTQSLAIIDYLEQLHREPPVYPADPVVRARAMAVAQIIASEIQPLNNSSVTDVLRDRHGADDADIAAWMSHFMSAGFAAIEQLIDGDHYAFGVAPTIADICIVPQVFNAHRYKVDISDFPKINAVADVAGAHPAFAAAHPSRQPSA
ncbi:MAG TPA: maleylacetoacetate isomerase [Rhodospirillales bacterium]|jgi:maleylpyruvate isomerase